MKEVSIEDYSKYQAKTVDELVHKQSKEQIAKKVDILIRKTQLSKRQITEPLSMTHADYIKRLLFLIDSYANGLEKELTDLKEIIENKDWK